MNLFLCDLYNMTLFIATISATIDCYLVELQTVDKTTPYIWKTKYTEGLVNIH